MRTCSKTLQQDQARMWKHASMSLSQHGAAVCAICPASHFQAPCSGKPCLQLGTSDALLCLRVDQLSVWWHKLRLCGQALQLTYSRSQLHFPQPRLTLVDCESWSLCQCHLHCWLRTVVGSGHPLVRT